MVLENFTGAEMIREKMYEKVQTFKRLGYSRSKIASELGLDHKTVAKYYKMDEDDFRAYRREQLFRDRSFEEYERDILEVYEENEFSKA